MHGCGADDFGQLGNEGGQRAGLRRGAAFFRKWLIIGHIASVIFEFGAEMRQEWRSLWRIAGRNGECLNLNAEGRAKCRRTNLRLRTCIPVWASPYQFYSVCAPAF